MTSQAISFRGHVVLGGVLECVTGLHVGGNRDSLVIGGLDLPVARDPATRLPVIPGSSLKGRLRSLLELLRGAPKDGETFDAVGLLFGGRSKDVGAGPTRLLVRDALPLDPHTRARRPDESTVNWWRLLETDGLGTEVKAETSINRITASAEPRQVERVVAGSRFTIEFVLNVFDKHENEERLLKDLLVALALLEDSYLGGHGSRGYGRVSVRLHERPAVVSRHDYERGRKRAEPSGELKSLDQIDADALVASVKDRLAEGAA